MTHALRARRGRGWRRSRTSPPVRELGPRGDGRRRALGGLGARASPTACPAYDRQPLLRVVADRHDQHRARDRSGELGVGLAAGVESMSRSGWALMKGDAPFEPRGPRVHARHDVGRRRRSAEPAPARAKRLHRDDRDRPERRRPVLDHPRGDRRVRAAVASACRPRRATPAGWRRRSFPVEIAGDTQAAGPRQFEHDEFIRDDTTLEKLADASAAAEHHRDDRGQLVAADSDGASARRARLRRARRRARREAARASGGLGGGTVSIRRSWEWRPPMRCRRRSSAPV